MWSYSSIKKRKLKSRAIERYDYRKAVQAIVSITLILLCFATQQFNQSASMLLKVKAANCVGMTSQHHREEDHFLEELINGASFRGIVTDRAMALNWQSETGWIKHKGQYHNSVYGFSVVIPKGMTGMSSRPPNPQHGIKINLSEKPESYLWVMANYDATGLGSLDKIAINQLDYLKEKNSEVKEISKSFIQVNKNRAVRLIVEYKDKDTSQMMTRDVIFILKAPASRGSDTGTIYELGLVTAQSRYQRDEKLLSSLQKTWKITGAPDHGR